MLFGKGEEFIEGDRLAGFRGEVNPATRLKKFHRYRYFT
jgi:hypothetical protein